MLAGFLFAVMTASGINNPLATRTYPVTYQMLEMAGAGFFIFAVAIIIFYSGELVWRERDAQLNQVIDAFPLQRWVLFSSKLLALMLVQVVVVLLILASGLVGADRPGLLSLRVQPLLPRAVSQPPDLALDSVRAGDVRADHRQQQVSRPLRDGAVHRGDDRAAAGGISGLSLPLRPDAAGHLFRHQRLWPVPAAAHLVPAVLGRRGDPAGDRHQPALGARHGEQLARAHEPGRSPLLARLDGWRQSVPGADARRRRLHLLQHPRAESLSHHLQDRRSARAIREEVPAVLVAMPQPRITDVNIQVDIYPERTLGLRCAAPCGWRTKPPRRHRPRRRHDLAGGPDTAARCRT